MRLLLDSHIPPALVPALMQRGIEALHLRDWRDGELLRAPDEAILHAARVDGLVLVTGDYRTVPGLLKRWAAEGRSHNGVIMAPDPADRIGNLARQVAALLSDLEDVDWTDRVVSLS